MATAQKPAKQPIDLQPVDLAAQAARPSKIRRDPPAAVRKTVVPDREIVDRRAVAIGIAAFALAIIVGLFGISDWLGWSPSQYTIHVNLH